MRRRRRPRDPASPCENAAVTQPEWIAPHAAAAELGMPLRRLYALIDEGRLRATRDRRWFSVSSHDVRRWRGDEGEGGTGVREPRRPHPTPGAGHRAVGET